MVCLISVLLITFPHNYFRHISRYLSMQIILLQSCWGLWDFQGKIKLLEFYIHPHLCLLILYCNVSVHLNIFLLVLFESSQWFFESRGCTNIFLDFFKLWANADTLFFVAVFTMFDQYGIFNDWSQYRWCWMTNKKKTILHNIHSKC